MLSVNSTDKVYRSNEVQEMLKNCGFDNYQYQTNIDLVLPRKAFLLKYSAIILRRSPKLLSSNSFILSAILMARYYEKWPIKKTPFLMYVSLENGEYVVGSMADDYKGYIIEPKTGNLHIAKFYPVKIKKCYV